MIFCCRWIIFATDEFDILLSMNHFFLFCQISSATDAINALINGTGSSENITSDESARLIEEARRIVDEIKARDFSDNEFMTDIELVLAKEGKIIFFSADKKC